MRYGASQRLPPKLIRAGGGLPRELGAAGGLVKLWLDRRKGEGSEEGHHLNAESLIAGFVLERWEGVGKFSRCRKDVGMRCRRTFTKSRGTKAGSQPKAPGKKA